MHALVGVSNAGFVGLVVCPDGAIQDLKADFLGFGGDVFVVRDIKGINESLFFRVVYPVLCLVAYAGAIFILSSVLIRDCFLYSALSLVSLIT